MTDDIKTWRFVNAETDETIDRARCTYDGAREFARDLATRRGVAIRWDIDHVAERRNADAAELRRFREREPLVQEIVAAVAHSDESDRVSSIKVDWENTDEDGTVYPRMWLREAAQLCMERFGKPEGQSE